MNCFACCLPPLVAKNSNHSNSNSSWQLPEFKRWDNKLFLLIFPLSLPPCI